MKKLFMRKMTVSIAGLSAFFLIFATSLFFYHASFAAPKTKMIDLGTLGGNFSSAAAVNNKGDEAGYSYDNQNISRAVIWLNRQIKDLGTLGGASSVALDMNDAYQVVGYAEKKSGDTHAFRWQNGKMMDLGTLGGDTSRAEKINYKGEVIGSSELANGDTHGFFWWWTKGLQDIGTLGGNRSVATDLNTKGLVTGYSTTSDGKTHAFVWTDGNMTDLGTIGDFNSAAIAINDKGEVAGYLFPAENEFPGEFHAVKWSKDGTLTELENIPGTISGIPSDINDRGEIVGKSLVASSTEYRAVLWDKNNQVHDLGTLGGFSAALKINNAGVVMGTSADSSGNSHGFKWYSGKITDLGTLGGKITFPRDINENGYIAGESFTDDSGQNVHGFVFPN